MIRWRAASHLEFFRLLGAGSVCGLIAGSAVAMLFAGVVEALRQWVPMRHASAIEVASVGLSALLGVAAVCAWQDLAETWKPSELIRESRAEVDLEIGSDVVQAAYAAKEIRRA